jgi:hypothetical protein
MRTFRKRWALARIGAPFFAADHALCVTNPLPVFPIGPHCGDVTQASASSSPTPDPTGRSQGTPPRLRTEDDHPGPVSNCNETDLTDTCEVVTRNRLLMLAPGAVAARNVSVRTIATLLNRGTEHLGSSTIAGSEGVAAPTRNTSFQRRLLGARAIGPFDIPAREENVVVSGSLLAHCGAAPDTQL